MYRSKAKFEIWLPQYIVYVRSFGSGLIHGLLMGACTANIAICPKTLSQLLANGYFGTTNAYVVFTSFLLSKKFVLKQTFTKVHSWIRN